jgi:hypothetical protein
MHEKGRISMSEGTERAGDPCRGVLGEKNNLLKRH